MSHDHLLDPVTVGALALPNRVVMAPMTRNRADEGAVPNALNAEYYAQRAGAGLQITEGTQPSAGGQGYLNTPGLHTDDQERGWKQVTDAVHAAGGRIAVQLMHVGRVSHPSVLPDGLHPVAPSVVKPDGGIFTGSGVEPYAEPRELSTEEVSGIVGEFADAAVRARRAGFDGIELHGGYGYLLQQFLSPHTNRRTDRYGGSVDARIRFTVEVAVAVADSFGADRVGIRLSPNTVNNDLRETEAELHYPPLLETLAELDLAWVHVVETPGVSDWSAIDFFRKHWSGRLIANVGSKDPISPVEADAIVADGRADLVSFARHALANPDFVERLRTAAHLNEADPATFYGGDHTGYTDYPTLADTA